MAMRKTFQKTGLFLLALSALFITGYFFESWAGFNFVLGAILLAVFLFMLPGGRRK